ncbi:MAG: ABC transporter permease [Methanobrevibacter olleyae]|uniref:ABC transporter permease n=1 Tax=Methanobrevibacter olleyae TaxID=294671 RepID=A0A8T3VYN1_METOL|nr:ABC transporter permease [Methanobrevibacter olleyae]
MRFINLILKNPFRNKTRSALSIIGIAIGITTIVALGLITTGMEDSVQASLNDVGAEITVSNSSSISTNTGLIDSEIVDEMKNRTGVIDAAGSLTVTEMNMDRLKSGSSDSRSSFATTVVGLAPEKLYMMGIKNIDGKVYENGSRDAIVGAEYAELNNVSRGDDITLQGKEFNVSGIFETGSPFVDSGIYVPLDTLQDITDKDGVSRILVKTGEDVNDSAISDKIEEDYENFTTLTSEEISSIADDVLGILDTATLAVSALAIIVGAIGIINTMVMAVYERTKEIGVLKSVGWKSRKILTMILGETLVLTTLSGIVGSIFGILIPEVGLRLFNVTDFALGYSPKTFILAFGITIIVGIIGGIYPAYKASKLAPTEALRYE